MSQLCKLENSFEKSLRKTKSVSYMSKTISKAIIVRGRLKTKYMRNISEENKRYHMRQRIIDSD